MLKKIFIFYIDSFRYMGKYPKRLILIILIKLVIFFGVLKIFFFQDYLSSKYETDEQKSEHVINQLIKP